MTWTELETAFHRALVATVQRRKFAIAFFAIMACAVLALCCKAFSHGASSWVRLNLWFLPILMSSGLLLSAGGLLVRMYYRPLSPMKVLLHSFDLLVGTSYLTLPSLFLYLFLWLLMGVFLLLRQIPLLGPAFGVLLAFGPFLLFTCSILLCLVNVSLLFFVTPFTATDARVTLSIGERLLLLIRGQALRASALFLIAIFPALFMGTLLFCAARLTQLHFVLSGEVLSATLSWLFVLIPFAALLAPTILFFFHFAAESHQLLCKSPFAAAGLRASPPPTSSSRAGAPL